MKPGCPVGYDDLRYVRLDHWDFDAEVQVGELVVHRDVAADVVGVFETLYDMRFPIRRMALVDDYGARDVASVADDNTSAFNCRERTDVAGVFSEHSYGWALDLNPRENPYVSAAGTTIHPASEPFLDRTTPSPGLIVADGPVVTAFAAAGWEWGGTWEPAQDYQHFSLTGR